MENKELKKIRNKKYREKNKEKIKELRKIYREKNKEKVKEQQKKYWKTYSEKNKEKIKEYQKLHREKRKQAKLLKQAGLNKILEEVENLKKKTSEGSTTKPNLEIDMLRFDIACAKKTIDIQEDYIEKIKNKLNVKLDEPSDKILENLDKLIKKEVYFDKMSEEVLCVKEMYININKINYKLNREKEDLEDKNKDLITRINFVKEMYEDEKEENEKLRVVIIDLEEKNKNLTNKLINIEKEVKSFIESIKK